MRRADNDSLEAGRVVAHRTLPFFPASLPDETLHSRVSRFHQLSGNLSEEQTFSQLFAQKPFDLGQHQPASPSLEVLAARLPGELNEQLQLIREHNTLLPVYRPFSSQGEGATATRGIRQYPALCLSCVREDDEKYGVAYWHRAHQVPRVAACWKHHESTLRGCPHCGHRFQRGCLLFGIPWTCRRCKRTLKNARGAPARHGSRYAEFTYAVLNAGMPSIPAELLGPMYSNRIKQLGFTFGGVSINFVQFAKSMIDHLGSDLVASIDPDFSKEGIEWLRQCVRDGGPAVPINRHLLLATSLFETVDEFNASRLNCVPFDMALTLELKSDRYAHVQTWMERSQKQISGGGSGKKIVPDDLLPGPSRKFGPFSPIWAPKWISFLPSQNQSPKAARRNRQT